MRRREAEAIVDDILNEIKYYTYPLTEAFERLDDTNELYLLRTTLVKIVMDEQ